MHMSECRHHYSRKDPGSRRRHSMLSSPFVRNRLQFIRTGMACMEPSQNSDNRRKILAQYFKGINVLYDAFENNTKRWNWRWHVVTCCGEERCCIEQEQKTKPYRPGIHLASLLPCEMIYSQHIIRVAHQRMRGSLVCCVLCLLPPEAVVLSLWVVVLKWRSPALKPYEACWSMLAVFIGTKPRAPPQPFVKPD